MQKFLLFSFLLITLSACTPEPPQLSEFRGVWVATVNNIDWPKHKQWEPDSQRQAFTALLDFYADHHFNAVVVQIRTAGDALYPTELAPWSRFLTGKEGKSPEPYYDPLAFMIEECHKRGMEFHAWLNPYRATTNTDTSLLSQQHVYYQHPEWMIRYGNRYYLNPGLPEARQHIVGIIAEVCEKYDIDGVHFDDYFYPYKVEGEVFDDSLAFANYGQAFADIDDWRRNNVNELVRELHETIQVTKPGIPFGISPFGVWRNKDRDQRGSATAARQTNYDDLYADCLKWMQEGWVDYIAPQLYFSMDYDKAAYRELAHWWAKEAAYAQLPVYTGIGVYKVNNNHDSAWYNIEEIPRQLQLNQQLRPIEGIITFSAKSLPQHPQLGNIIKSQFFKEKTLPFVRKQLPEMVPVIDSLHIDVATLSVQFRNIDSFDLESVLVFEETSPGQFTRLIHRFWLPEKNNFTLSLSGIHRPIAFAFLDKNRNLSLLTNPITLREPFINIKTQ